MSDRMRVCHIPRLVDFSEPEDFLDREKFGPVLYLAYGLDKIMYIGTLIFR